MFFSDFVNWIKVFDFLILYDNILYYLCKYVGVFFFILWILFESFFLRFYLVDTPLDAKMFQDRKENTSGKRRFIPIIGFEALSFYIRPFYRVFNTTVLFMSNLSVLAWLIYYVYFLDFFKAIGFVLNVFFKFFFFFIVFFYLLVDFFLFFYRRHVYPVCLLFLNRFIFKCKNFFDFFIYCYHLPALLVNHLVRFILIGIPKTFYFVSLLNITELKLIYLKSFQKQKIIAPNDLFGKFFHTADKIEIFIRYIEFKMLIMPVKFSSYFNFLNRLYNFLSNSFIGKLLHFIYFICFICFLIFSLWLLFLILILFPFII